MNNTHTFTFTGDRKYLLDSEEKYERLLVSKYHLPYKKIWEEGSLMFHVAWKETSDLALAAILFERTNHIMTFIERIQLEESNAIDVARIVDHIKSRREDFYSDLEREESEKKMIELLKKYYSLTEKDIENYLK